MILRCISGATSRWGDVGVRAFRDRCHSALQRHKRRPDEGGLLIEVLVGMLVLVIVFTATSAALSSMADQRVRIEQRDRALAILANYEELSRVYQCGFVVDRIDDGLSSAGTAGGGTTDFETAVNNCDFAAKATEPPVVGKNAGDQDFDVTDTINETNKKQTFHVSIRYWWEVPGSDAHTQDCSYISTKFSGGVLPLILTRAFEVRWDEGNVKRKETLIKREAIPNDDVVFVSGSRVNILVNPPTPTPDWFVSFAPALDASGTGINTSHVIERHIDGMLGQPTACAWFPYITPDTSPDRLVGRSTTVPSPPLSTPIPVADDSPPQSFKPVS